MVLTMLVFNRISIRSTKLVGWVVALARSRSLLEHP